MNTSRYRTLALAGLRFFNDPGDGAGASGGAPAPSGPPDGGTPPNDGDGFPPHTPVAEMTAEQQAAYWKKQSRKHENRVNQMGDYDQLKADAAALAALREKDKTPEQKTLDDAREAGRQAAEEAYRQELAAVKVRAEFRAHLHAKSAEEFADLIENVNLTNFLTNGEVDTDKVEKYAAQFVPKDGAGGRWPGTGQGYRGPEKKPTGVQAGRDMWADRHEKK